METTQRTLVKRYTVAKATLLWQHIEHGEGAQADEGQSHDREG